MIFLTVGTELPFDRLTKTVDAWCAARDRSDVHGQLGSLSADGFRPTHFEWCSFMPTEEYERRCQQCDLIVGHAGIGTIIAAMTHAKPLVIMPRMAAKREHRNDHQLATARHFADKTGITVAADETVLPDILDRTLAAAAAAPIPPVSQFADPELVATIQTFIMAD